MVKGKKKEGRLMDNLKMQIGTTSKRKREENAATIQK